MGLEFLKLDQLESREGYLKVTHWVHYSSQCPSTHSVENSRRLDIDINWINKDEPLIVCGWPQTWWTMYKGNIQERQEDISWRNNTEWQSSHPRLSSGWKLQISVNGGGRKYNTTKWRLISRRNTSNRSNWSSTWNSMQGTATNILAVPVFLYSYGVFNWKLDEIEDLDKMNLEMEYKATIVGLHISKANSQIQATLRHQSVPKKAKAYTSEAGTIYIITNDPPETATWKAKKLKLEYKEDYKKLGKNKWKEKAMHGKLPKYLQEGHIYVKMKHSQISHESQECVTNLSRKSWESLTKLLRIFWESCKTHDSWESLANLLRISWNTCKSPTNLLRISQISHESLGETLVNVLQISQESHKNRVVVVVVVVIIIIIPQRRSRTSVRGPCLRTSALLLPFVIWVL